MNRRRGGLSAQHAGVRDNRSCDSVLMVGTGGTMGGIGSVVRAYSQSSLFRKFRIKYVATHQGGGLIARIVAAARGWVVVFWSLCRLEAPLVHIHLSSRGSFFRKLGVCSLARLFRRPYILHVHGSEFMQFYEHECGPLTKRAVQWTFENAGLMLALSEQWKSLLLSICPSAHIEVLPNGVPIPDVSSKPEHASIQTILFLGRLGKRKGTYELVNAFHRIANRFPDAVLICAGDGDVKELQALAAELGIADKTKFPGWTTAEQTRHYLSVSSIFALPSYAEGLPMALLEAMSWQLAVISSPVGGIPTVLRDQENGLLVTPGDVDSLSRALSSLLADPDLRSRLSEAARATVEREYSLESSIRKLSEIYRRFGLCES
jgi:glycosyltransferase involved in cell wall biosynthesis